MDFKQFEKYFKNAKFSLGWAPILLGGLALLGLKSYYYGNSQPI